MNILLVTFAIIGVSQLTFGADISPRIINGVSIDTTRRFPHHVSIETVGVNAFRNCSGSIIGDQWILTSISCVQDGDRHRIDFNRIRTFSDDSSYSVEVSHSKVFEYPTGFDDIALIKLPIKLQFDKYVNSISIVESDKGLDNQLVVMPGIDDNKNMLTYGMFKLLPNGKCLNSYGSEFDEYLQLCTEAWIKNNNQYPCGSDLGGGLVVGWPRKPQLVAVFSTPVPCEQAANAPAVYWRISKYVDWINSIIQPYQTTTAIPAK